MSVCALFNKHSITSVTWGLLKLKGKSVIESIFFKRNLQPTQNVAPIKSHNYQILHFFKEFGTESQCKMQSFKPTNTIAEAGKVVKGMRRKNAGGRLGLCYATKRE